ncbi:hypothetical protein Tco_0618287 [Tanacetum coccineum]
MHTSKDDYLINTLIFVSRKEASQIYGVVLPECLTSPKMKESKAYKTYLGHATAILKTPTPPPTIETTNPLSTLPDFASVFRFNDRITAKKAQLKEVRKKSLRDFHKTHPSGSGTIAEKPPSVEKITPTIQSEGTGDKPGVPDVIKDDSTESESESWGNDEDDNNNKQEACDKGNGQENASEEQESDLEQDEEFEDDNQEEEEIDQENDLKKIIESDEDRECADVEMKEAQQGNENLETTQEQVVDDAHVTITTTKKTEVPVTSSSRSSDLASKFLNFSNIPHTDAEIVSPLDVHVHHEVPRTQAPTLLTIPISVITESSPVLIKIP